MDANNTMVQLAENTALLSLLETYPEKPKSNTRIIREPDESPRQMSFDQERRICAGLAFLAGISNDPNHITAVAVQESGTRSEIIIKISINKSRPSDNEDMLTALEGGLHRVFDVLSRVAHGDPKATGDSVFKEVALACRERILTRLRSRKAILNPTRKQKPPLLSLLRSVMEAVTRTVPSARRRNFTREAPTLLALLEAFEKQPQGPEEQKLLRGVIKRIRHFMAVVKLPLLLSKVKKGVLDPSMGDAVVDEFTKLAHYRTVARSLFEKARKMAIFQHFRVETVSPSAEHFSTFNKASYTPSPAVIAERLHQEAKTRTKLKSILEEPSNLSTFETTVKRTLASGRIHAEVQLMAHFESNSDFPPPRVIASSKSACFLCNTLFALHGRYHMPWTHGRLYPGWMLPTNIVPGPNQLASRMNEKLGEYIAKSIENRLPGFYKKRKLGPNESTISQFSESVSTLVTSLASTLGPSGPSSESSSVSTIRPCPKPQAEIYLTEPNQSTLKVDLDRKAPSDGIGGVDNLSSGSSISLAQPGSACGSLDISSESDLGSSSEIHTAENSAQPTALRIEQGQLRSVSISPEQAPVCIYTDFLQILIERPGKGKALSASPEMIVVDVEWLSTSATSDHDPETAHNVYSLSTETETACKSSGEVLLRVGDQVVRLNRR